MGIFKPDYSNTNNNAYLNWWFDERVDDKDVQISWDFFNMGKAYYANAITSLTILLDAGNAGGLADKMIFPILFGFWHGTELLLKAGLYLVEKELNTGNPFSKISHDNSQLFSELMSRLKKIGFKSTDFRDLKNVLDEFKAKNASPTFMRYTVDNNMDEQFYIDLSPDRENTCINLIEFTNKFAGIIETLPILIEFLGVPYFGDRFTKGQLNKANYVIYLSELEQLEKAFEKHEPENFTDNLNMTNKMLQWAYSHLL